MTRESICPRCGLALPLRSDNVHACPPVVVEAAARLFGGGVDGVSFPAIAEAVGSSKGALQRVWPTKDLLVAAVAERAIDDAGRTPADEPEAEAWARLWAALRTYASEGRDELLARLDTLHAGAVHPARLAALERLLFGRPDAPRLFPRRAA